MGCAGSKNKGGGLAGGRKHKPVRAKGDVPGGDRSKRNRAPVDDGIPAFAPGAALSDAYAAYIRDVRRAGVEAGVLKPVDHPHEQERSSITRNNRRTAAGTTYGVKSVEPAGGGKRGGAASSSASSDAASADLLSATPPPASVTVYQCQPMPGESVIGKGQYGQVMLASMSLVQGELAQIEPQRTRLLSEAPSNSINDLRGAGAGVGGGSLSSQVGAGSEVAAAARTGLYSEHHFLIAMKEITLLSSQPQSLVLEEVKRQVRRWSRLAAYSPRIIRCIQMECVYPGGGGSGGKRDCGPSGGDSPQHRPAPSSTFHDFDGIVRPNNGLDRTGPSASSSRKSGRLRLRGQSKDGKECTNTNAASVLVADEPISGTPSKLRIYMEFAKYGTLRTMQIREMPERFGKPYLHELTARALMREVLLALVDVHEQNEVQYDVCAKNVFLIRPICSVYGTYFPAYIADLPVGPLMRVPPDKMQDAVCLMNPSLTLGNKQQQQQQGDSSNCEGPLQPFPGVGHSPHAALACQQQYPDRQGIEAASPVVSYQLTPLQDDATGAGGGHAFRNNLSMMAIPPADLGTGEACGAGFAFDITGSESHGYPLQPTHHRAYAEDGTAAEGNAGSKQGVSQHSGHSTSNGNGAVTAAGDDPIPSNISLALSRDASSVPGESHPDDVVTKSSVVYNSVLMEEQRWLKDDLREYTQQHGYDDCVSLPVPSPHDGIAGYDLAYAVAKMTVKGELDPQHTCAQVYPLREVKNGGVVVVNHDRFSSNHNQRHNPRIARPQSQQQNEAAPTSSKCGGITKGDSASVDGAGGTPGHAGVIEAGSISFVPRGLKPITSPPPQCLPSSADVACYVMPSTVVAGAGTWAGHAPRAGVESLQLDASSTHSGSPACAGRGGGAASASSHHTVPRVSGGAADRFRGPLVRLGHTAAIRRCLALTNANTSLNDVPVHRFVAATHAAPEVLQRREFSPASDIFSFGMTFIELVTDPSVFLSDCMPTDLPKPKTRKEKDDYNRVLAANMNKWYNSRINAMNLYKTALAEERRLPDQIQPSHRPVVVRIPAHLSDECKNMLKRCLQTEPGMRPSAVELLKSTYFLFGDWISESSRRAGRVQLPEEPWGPEAADRRSYELLAQNAGYPIIPETLFSPNAGVRRRSTAS